MAFLRRGAMVRVVPAGESATVVSVVHPPYITVRLAQTGAIRRYEHYQLELVHAAADMLE